jgi:glycerol-3-phosphate dehydrogenase
MSRLDAITNREFDVLIIGAGIYGATLAYHAASAGLSVALIDKGDYGSGASANSLKILHGGIRYLQQADIPRMRESIRARRDAFIHLPHLTRPARFLAPVGKGLKRSSLAYRLAGWMNDCIGMDRNFGPSRSHHLGRTEVWNKKAIMRHCPALQAYDGALCWGDGFIENTERYTMAYILSAISGGCTALNYIKAIELLRHEGRVTGVAVADADNSETGEIRARLVVNTSGLWQTSLQLSDREPAQAVEWLRAWNIVVRKKWFGDYGVGLDGTINGTRRNFFFAPWGHHTLIGTVYDAIDPARDSLTLTRADILRFIHDINLIYPDAKLSLEDVTFAHAGIQPGMAGMPQEPARRSLEIKRWDAHLVAVQGVKYTTASMQSRALCKEITRFLGKGKCARPLLLPVGGAFSAATLEDLVRMAIVDEQARHLDDIILRRASIGTTGYPDEALIQRICNLAGPLWGYSATSMERERERLKQSYRQLGLNCP